MVEGGGEGDSPSSVFECDKTTMHVHGTNWCNYRCTKDTWREMKGRRRDGQACKWRVRGRRAEKNDIQALEGRLLRKGLAALFGADVKVLPDGSRLFQFTSKEVEERENKTGNLDTWIHFVGVGGTGLSALARIAHNQGHVVTGSDQEESPNTMALRKEGVEINVGHSALHLMRRCEDDAKKTALPTTLVLSSAVPSNNVEVMAAKVLGIQIYKRSEWLSRVTDSQNLVAVAGTHGKTTTSAMIAVALRESGTDATAVIGSGVQQFPGGQGAVLGSSNCFVLEADEYDGAFLGLKPLISVITNVEWDHVDLFPTEASTRTTFRAFASKTVKGGVLVLCGDDAGSKSLRDVFGEDAQQKDTYLKAEHAVVTYGLGVENNWQATALTPNPEGGTDFVVVHNAVPVARVNLPQPGLHNVLNALASVCVCSILGACEATAGDTQCKAQNLASFADVHEQELRTAASKAAFALSSFKGIKRRFEQIGRIPNVVTVFDDYAHHPTEVRATLQAARQRFDKQPIWVVFQPHTYTRLVAMMDDFAPAFSAADRVIVTDVYSARELEDGKGTAKALADAIVGPPVSYIPSLGQVVERLAWELPAEHKAQSGDSNTVEDIILIAMGAGDIYKLGPELIKKISIDGAD